METDATDDDLSLTAHQDCNSVFYLYIVYQDDDHQHLGDPLRARDVIVVIHDSVSARVVFRSADGKVVA